MICPNCKKQELIYKPWLGQIWECRNCGYRGVAFIEDLAAQMRVLLRRIPRGKVTTYGILAKKLGTSPRAVAKMLSVNDPKAAPCFKVVKSDGSVGGYSGKGGVKKKIQLLKRDGIEVRRGKIDLKRFGYKF